MFRILEAELIDFAQHRHVKQKLEGNVSGITGENGLGKSNFLLGLQFGLTGTIDHDDPLPKFIREEDSAKPPKKATAKITFEADGKRGTLVRNVTPTTTSRELRWDGCLDDKGNVKVLSSDKAVSEMMFQILGVDKRAINSTVFIKQGAIGNMFGKPSDRRDFYTRLLMLGHHDKTADTVDIYRKQMVDSVQDLSAVKDAADATYDAAVAHFEDMEHLLKELRTWTAETDAANRLVGLFEEQASAELALASAKTRQTALEAIDPAALLKEKAALVAKADAISTDRRKWAEDATKHDTAKRVLEQAQQLRGLQLQMAAARAERDVAAALMQEGNPSGKIDDLDETIKLHARAGELPDLVTAARAAHGAATAEVVRLTEARQKAEEVYRGLNDSYNTVNTDIATRSKIKDEIAAHACGAECVVCGSKTTDADYLTRSIEVLRAEKDRLMPLHTAALTADMGVRHDLDAAISDQGKRKSELDKLVKELSMVKAGLIGALSADEAARQRGELVQKVAAYNVAAAEASRLALVISGLTRQVGASPEVTENALAALLAGLQDAPHPGVWNTADDASESLHRVRIGEIDRTLTANEKTHTELKEAQSRLERVENDMGTHLLTAQHDLPRLAEVWAAYGTLTAQDALSAASAIRVNQAAYDQQVGALESSKASLKHASDAVVELDLKIAEQAHRRKLVADLTRLRDTFRPAGATMDYLDHKFGRIAELAADYLAESQADFMVAASATEPLAYEFLRLRPGEKWLSQNRTSGGQRVRLAVATLRAIHALIMPNVGLLVLDEPTTHLDTSAKMAMADMLRRIGEEGTLQMIVCDHDPILIDAFSSIIELGGN